MAITIRCECGQMLTVPAEAAGREVMCPACNRRFTAATPRPDSGQETPPEVVPVEAVPPSAPGAPVPPAAPPRPQWGVIRCWQCQAVNDAGAPTCKSCGAHLPPPTPTPYYAPPPVAAPKPTTTPPAPSGTVQRMIPYRNVPALVGYYLAVFALIPCVGVLLGIAATVLGVIGWVRAQQHPEARGKGHVIFATIFGIVCAVGHVVLLINLEAIMDLVDM